MDLVQIIWKNALRLGTALPLRGKASHIKNSLLGQVHLRVCDFVFQKQTQSHLKTHFRDKWSIFLDAFPFPEIPGFWGFSSINIENNAGKSKAKHKLLRLKQSMEPHRHLQQS